MSNESLFFLIRGFSDKNFLLDQTMIFGADYLIYFVFLIITALTIKGSQKEKSAMVLIFLSIPIAVLLIKLIHLFYYLPRPFTTYDFSPMIHYIEDASFPSRHTTIATTIAFAYFFAKSKFFLLFLTFALWVGISRIFVGVHYPLDILGGFFLGIISVGIGIKLKKVLLKFI